MSDDDIIAIRDSLLPSQGEQFDCIKFARAVLADQEAISTSLVQALKLIEHATAPSPRDNGYHEAAYTLAKRALSIHKWDVA